MVAASRELGVNPLDLLGGNIEPLDIGHRPLGIAGDNIEGVLIRHRRGALTCGEQSKLAHFF
jgi:hypothetical protein